MQTLFFLLAFISFAFLVRFIIAYIDFNLKSVDLRIFGGGRSQTASSVPYRADNLKSGKKIASPQARIL